MSKQNTMLRAIPKEVAFFNTRKAMRVYFHLLLNSSLQQGSEGLRVAEKNNSTTSISGMGRALNMDNKTVRSHIRKLEETGFIIVDEQNYTLVKPQQYQLVHTSIIQELISEECPYIIPVYSELLNKFQYFTIQKKSETTHTQSQLFRELSGKQVLSGSIVDKIGKAIELMAERGLLSYRDKFIEETGNTIMVFTYVAQKMETNISASAF